MIIEYHRLILLECDNSCRTYYYYYYFTLFQQSSDNTLESRRNLCAKQGRLFKINKAALLTLTVTSSLVCDEVTLLRVGVAMGAFLPNEKNDAAAEVMEAGNAEPALACNCSCSSCCSRCTFLVTVGSDQNTSCSKSKNEFK